MVTLFFLSCAPVTLLSPSSPLLLPPTSLPPTGAVWGCPGGADGTGLPFHALDMRRGEAPSSWQRCCSGGGGPALGGMMAATCAGPAVRRVAQQGGWRRG